MPGNDGVGSCSRGACSPESYNCRYVGSAKPSCATEKEGVVPAFRCSATLASPNNKRKRNADRRSDPRAVPPGTAAHPSGCAHLSAFHRGSDPGELSSQGPSSRPCFLGRGLAPIL